MGRSLSLALYLMAAARGAPAPAPARPDRPDCPLIWFHLGAGSVLRSIAQLIRQLQRHRPDLRFLVTVEGSEPSGPLDLPKGILTDLVPSDRLPDLRGFLNHWRPDLAILTGTSLPPALIAEAHDRHVPLILADIGLTPGITNHWRWRRGMAGSLLARFERILARDPDTATRLHKIGGQLLHVEVAGRIEETTEPLSANEAEREALAELLQNRPVWLAVNCPEAEEDAVLAAHQHAMRLAHRMLLILVPADPSRAEPLTDKLGRLDWVTALRAHDEEPDPEVQVFIADGESELGLWYRLAPVTYMGGTLVSGQSGRNPFEPAALGSAILHGAFPGPYPDAYRRLTEARAARLVATPASLADAVGDLIAPDKAATLAHNAWAASSGGAEVTERVAEIILSTLNARSGRSAA